MDRRATVAATVVVAALVIAAMAVVADVPEPPASPRRRAVEVDLRTRQVVLSASTPDAGHAEDARPRASPPQLPAGLRAAESDAETAAQALLLAALYGAWDADAFGELMVEGADAVALEETLAWFHARLGECAAPEILAVADSGSVRWVYPCAGGELEAEFGMEDDRVRRLMLGAHHIEPPAEVRAAAEVVLALQRSWSDELFAATFSAAFDSAETRAYLGQHTADWGVCTLERVDLGGARGGLLDVACEHGPRLLKVQLDDDDRITETWFGEPRGY